MRAIVTLPSSAVLWADGGFTLALNYQDPTPARFIVSDAGGLAFDREPTAGELAAFIRARWPALSRPGAYLGGWRDPDSGRYFLDVSRGHRSIVTAHAAARAAAQIAIWDRVEARAIMVGA